jgi:hypothetical protein
LSDCEAYYGAYGREALDVVENVSRVYMISLIGCKWFSVVTYHATFTSLLIQPCDKLIDWLVHFVEPLIPFDQCTSVLSYRRTCS